VQALKAQGLKDPLVGAVDVNYTKVMVPLDKIDVPPAFKKKKKPRRPVWSIGAGCGHRELGTPATQDEADCPPVLLGTALRL
jgi:hypothetical protein